MVTLGSRLARLPVRFRLPHPFVVVLVVALMLVPVSAVELQSADDGIMPLNLSSSESTWLNQIYTYVGHNSALGTLQSLMNDVKNYLSYNNHTAGYYLYYINDRLASGGQSLAYWAQQTKLDLDNIYSTLGAKGSNGSMSDNLKNASGYLYNIQNYMLANGQSVSYWTRQIWVYLDEVLNSHLNTVKSSLSSISSGIGSSNTALGTANTTLDAILAALNEGNTKEWPTYTGSLGLGYRMASNLPFSDSVLKAVVNMSDRFYWEGDSPYLHSDGTYYRDTNIIMGKPLVYYFLQGYAGISSNLTGSDKTTVFSFLAEDITQPAISQSADNILDALGIMGTQLQNPLQRLAYVFANPTDLEIRENVSENTEETNEQFFKPGAPGSVSGGNIKDAAGLTSGLGGLLKSPVSMVDAWGQLGNDENYAFFSERTYHELNTVNSPAPVSFDSDEFLSQYEVDEDGFVHFYQPGNASLFDLIGRGG